jgi:cobalt/nickel transport protein
VTDGKRTLTTVRKLWIGIALLAILSPLGLVLPKLFHAGGAWGEWSLDELRQLLGFLPAGMEQSGRRWTAPLAGYAVPEQTVFFHEGLGYVLSALLGIGAVALVAWALDRVLRRKNSRQE